MSATSVTVQAEAGHYCTFLVSDFVAVQAEAGHYCTFLVADSGCVRACGKGSYGRLGLGDSNNQASPTQLVRNIVMKLLCTNISNFDDANIFRLARRDQHLHAFAIKISLLFDES